MTKKKTKKTKAPAKKKIAAPKKKRSYIKKDELYWQRGIFMLRRKQFQKPKRLTTKKATTTRWRQIALPLNKKRAA